MIIHFNLKYLRKNSLSMQDETLRINGWSPFWIFWWFRWNMDWKRGDIYLL